MTIWKYEHALSDEIQLKIPAPAVLRKAAILSPGIFTFWFQVEPDEETRKRNIKVYGTGHKMEPGETYIDSLFDAPFTVWHLFQTW